MEVSWDDKQIPIYGNKNMFQTPNQTINSKLVEESFAHFLGLEWFSVEKSMLQTPLHLFYPRVIQT